MGMNNPDDPDNESAKNQSSNLYARVGNLTDRLSKVERYIKKLDAMLPEIAGADSIIPKKTTPPASAPPSHEYTLQDWTPGSKPSELIAPDEPLDRFATTLRGDLRFIKPDGTELLHRKCPPPLGDLEVNVYGFLRDDIEAFIKTCAETDHIHDYWRHGKEMSVIAQRLHAMLATKEGLNDRTQPRAQQTDPGATPAGGNLPGAGQRVWDD